MKPGEERPRPPVSPEMPLTSRVSLALGEGCVLSAVAAPSLRPCSIIQCVLHGRRGCGESCSGVRWQGLGLGAARGSRAWLQEGCPRPPAPAAHGDRGLG